MGEARAKQAREDYSRCAYCGAAATGKDHVPPKCIFPDDRLNLITVPACDEHNNQRSGLDQRFLEFVGFATASVHGLKTPLVERAVTSLERNPARLADIRRHIRPVLGGSQLEVRLHTGVLKEACESMARGIYWKRRQTVLGLEIPLYVERYRLDVSIPSIDGLVEYKSGGGQFRYRFGYLPDHPSISLTVMNFHDAINVFAISNQPLIDKINREGTVQSPSLEDVAAKG